MAKPQSMQRDRIGRQRMGWPVLAAALAGWAVSASAQDAGGQRLVLGVETRLQSSSNPSLTLPGGPREAQFSTRLSFGYVTETRLARLALDGSVRLRLRETGRNGIVSPQLNLSYGREVAGARLAATLFRRESDLSEDRGFDQFGATSGTRTDTGGTLDLRWGEDRRIGFGLTGSLTDSRFRNAPGEVDRRQSSLGGDIRLGLSDIADLTLGVTRSRFAPVGGVTRITTSYQAGLAFQRPDGELRLTTGLDDTPDGQRRRLLASRSLALPGGGALSARIGATTGTSGGTRMVGGLGYERELPAGRLTADLDRSITSSSETDAEQQITRAALGLSRELTPLTRISLNLGLAESRSTATGIATRNATFDVTLGYLMTEDWTLDLGYRHRQERQAGGPAARDNMIFLGLRRDFETRF